MEAEEAVKCAHGPCQCSVGIDQMYCSASCGSEQSSETPCSCGHAECSISNGIAAAIE